ncbi:MAG TPA: plastocyanin/azurin family copper-binding protein [Anaerolineae bacterium]|nr:plastocyanin/azurin family copper-binding protein [Anaerolineae bacterium]
MSNSNRDRSGFQAARGRLARIAGVWLAVVLVVAGCGATAEPGAAPTNAPLDVAPAAETALATDAPAAAPTEMATVAPTEMPTMMATDAPAATAEPMAQPGTPAAALPTVVPGDEAEVEIEDFAFNPPVLVIRVGTEVKWSNKDEAQHTATSDTGVWDSGYLSKDGEDFFFTFTEPGEYPYYCIPHGGPGGVGMAGTVIVVE